MDRRLQVLKLVLNAMGMSSRVDTVTDRKRVQKAIYLGQLAGADLGYRYNWYVKGPYSPSLTRDYFELADLEAAGSADTDRRLRSELEQKLIDMRPLLRPPADWERNDADWLELIASLHFLLGVRGESPEKARTTFEHEKPHLAQHVDLAKESLASAGLI